jgi:hypothetical protein
LVHITQRVRSQPCRASGHLSPHTQGGGPWSNRQTASSPASTGANHQRRVFTRVDRCVGGLQIGGGVVGDLGDATSKESRSRYASRHKCQCGKVPVVSAGIVGGDPAKSHNRRVVRSDFTRDGIAPHLVVIALHHRAERQQRWVKVHLHGQRSNQRRAGGDVDLDVHSITSTDGCKWVEATDSVRVGGEVCVDPRRSKVAVELDPG